MAWTARGEDEKKEFLDSPEELKRKVETLAQWFRESKHSIAFTGAGISTSAGIPDFRSGMNTILDTGPGAWELRDKGKLRDTTKHKETTTVKAIPTATHRALVKLQEEGLLKCVISQNCDGLHRRSGMPHNALFELHGNSNVEKCSKCKREYLRDHRVRTAKTVHNHLTGRLCDDPKCRGKLKDTIINFGENLPEKTLEASFDHAEKADLCLAMGSSLTVRPATDVPERVGKKGKQLVVVNLQRTPLDPLCALRIFAKTDDVMYQLMAVLGKDIPEFQLHRCLVLKTTKEAAGHVKVEVSGADKQGYPFSFLKQVILSDGRNQVQCNEEPFIASLPVRDKQQLTVEVIFYAHYREPPVTLPLRMDVPLEMVNLLFNPFTGEWSVRRDGEEKGEVEEVTAQMAATSV